MTCTRAAMRGQTPPLPHSPPLDVAVLHGRVGGQPALRTELQQPAQQVQGLLWGMGEEAGQLGMPPEGEEEEESGAARSMAQAFPSIPSHPTLPPSLPPSSFPPSPLTSAAAG